MADEFKWIRCDELMPEEDRLVLVCIYGSDLIMPAEGETVEEAILRDQKCASATLGFYGEEGWEGVDGWPLMLTPTYWAEIPKPPDV